MDIELLIQSCRKVTRPILAVSRLTEKGNDVSFFRTYGRIVNTKTKKAIRFYRKGGVYVLGLWIRTNSASSSATSFRRQGA